MKLTTALLFMSMIQMMAATGFSQYTELSLKFDNAEVREVLGEIEKISEVYFLYSSKLVDVDRKVSINTRNQNIENVLAELFRGENVDFTFMNDQIIIAQGESAPQPRVIRGTVTNESGEPLVGVTISIKGTTSGTITNVNGEYELEVSDATEILVYQFVGMITQEIQIEDKISIYVTMKQDLLNLDEVVVIGYGTMKKSDLTGSVSSIREQELDNVVLNSVAQTLQGRAAGVHVIEHSGEPGSGITVKIRGSNSLLGSQDPLYVVDGIPISNPGQAQQDQYWTGSNSLANLNPYDIESIEILKDASATAIYGSRASNGVILITTKKATRGPTRVTVNARYGIVTTKAPYIPSTAEQFAAVRNERYMLASPHKTEAELIAEAALPYMGQDEWHPLPDTAGVGTNFIDAILQQGNRQNIEVGFSGGDDRSTHYILFNYEKEEGLLLNSNLQKGNLKVNLGNNITDKLHLTTILNASVLNRNRQNTSSKTGLSGSIFKALGANPLIPLSDDAGDPNLIDQNGDFFTNPYADALYSQNNSANKDASLSLQAKYDILPELSLNLRLTGSYRLSDRRYYYPRTTQGGNKLNGSAVISNLNHANLANELFLNYDKQFSVHSINTVAGVSYEHFNTYTQRQGLTNFTFDEFGINALQMGTSRDYTNSNRTEYTLNSGFLRFNYVLMEKYLLTITGRADGSSKFGADNKWAYFPSFALAWRASQEDFIQNLNVFSNLKFRFSYGSAGSQAISPYQTLSRYNISLNPMADEQLYTAIVPGSIGNPTLKWETTKSMNVGVDMGFIQNKLRVTAEYYKKNTIDLLLNMQLPSMTGYGQAISNLGELENYGVELSIDAYPVTSGKFNWNTRLNISSNNSKVISLGENEYIEPGNVMVNLLRIPATRFVVGRSLGLFYGYVTDGLAQVDDYVDYFNGDLTIATDADGNPKILPGNFTNVGSIQYKDLNEDGRINIDDREIIGDANPDFIFGWTNNLSYGPLNLMFIFQGSVGNEILNITNMLGRSGSGVMNQDQFWFDRRWTLENQHNDPRYPSFGNVQTVPSKAFVEDGSYVRLKALTLSYTLPTVRKGYRRAEVYFSATNLITLTNYTGADPEVDSYNGNIITQGMDNFSYPRPKVYSIGLNITF